MNIETRYSHHDLMRVTPTADCRAGGDFGLSIDRERDDVLNGLIHLALNHRLFALALALAVMV
jgi:hypothetical protein